MADVRFTRASPEEIMKGIQRQARGKKVPVECPNCDTVNQIDAGDILEGGNKEIRCDGCELVFRMTGEKK